MMIKDYELISGFVNLDCGAGDEKICYVELDIRDKEEVLIAQKICDISGRWVDNGVFIEGNGELVDGEYYKNGWLVEMNINEDATNTLGNHTLFFVGDDGRVEIREIGDKELIASLDKFLLDELTYKEVRK